MKTKIFLVGSLLTAGIALTSCSDDFLDQKNTTSPNQETFFDSDEAIDKAMYPLYNYVWQSFNDKAYYGMGDGRANNLTAQYSDYIYPYTNFNETSLSPGLSDAWGSLYSVVAQSNNTINNILTYSTSAVSEEAKTRGVAEARFMRGVAYWYIASLWGNAIIYTRTSDLVNNYVVPANPRADVMEFAIRDLEYAAAYLPATSPESGRINKYSAYGMLSRVYLSMAGLTTEGQYDGNNVATDFNRGTRNTYYLELARKAAMKVINESDFKLMTNYGDLFKIENNNCRKTCSSCSGTKAQPTLSDGDATRQSPLTSDGQQWLQTEPTGEVLHTLLTTSSPNMRTTTCASMRGVAWYGEYYPDMYTKGGGYTYGVTENAGSQVQTSRSML